MNYLKKSFSVTTGETKQYRDNWDRIFGRGPEQDKTDQDSDSAADADPTAGSEGEKPEKRGTKGCGTFRLR